MESVNFESLREITEGDSALEAELFRGFLSSSVECIRGLQAALDAGNEGEWRKHAHAFKGICLNLGAMPLGELCKKAQEDYRAGPEDKRQMVAAIETEYARVREAVESEL